MNPFRLQSIFSPAFKTFARFGRYEVIILAGKHPIAMPLGRFYQQIANNTYVYFCRIYYIDYIHILIV